MKTYFNFCITLLFVTLAAPCAANANDPVESPVKSDFQKRSTAVSIAGDRFYFNGKPTCFDYRKKGEGFDEGYQSVPVNWKTSSERKRGFYKLLSEITGQHP